MTVETCLDMQEISLNFRYVLKSDTPPDAYFGLFQMCPLNRGKTSLLPSTQPAFDFGK